MPRTRKRAKCPVGIVQPQMGLADLCEDMLHAIFELVHADDPVAFLMQRFTCQRAKVVCAKVSREAARRPSESDTVLWGNYLRAAVMRQAFSDGDLVRLRWAHLHSLGGPAFWDLPLKYYNTVVHLAGCAIRPDGHGDAAFQWYLDTFFFPALSAFPQDPAPESEPVYTWHEPTHHGEIVAWAGSAHIRNAAACGRLDLLPRLITAGARLRIRDCEHGMRNARTVDAAAYFLYHPVVGERDPLENEFECAVGAAAYSGNTPVLDFLLRARGLPLPPDTAAALASREATARAFALYSLASTINRNKAAIAVEASLNNIAAPALNGDDERELEYCVTVAYAAAAQSGQLQVLNWLFACAPQYGVPEDTLQRAVANSQMNATQWAAARLPRNIVVQWTWFSYQRGMLVFELDATVLEWLVEHYPPSSGTAVHRFVYGATDYAADTGHFCILAMLLRRGFTIDYKTVWDLLGWQRPARMLVAAIAWLLRRGPAPPDLYIRAANKGRADIVDWLRNTVKIPGYDTAASEIGSALGQAPATSLCVGPVSRDVLSSAEELLTTWERM